MPKYLYILLLLLFPTALLGHDGDFFDMSLEELMSVPVGIASVERQDVESAHSVVSVLTRKEIEALGAENLREALEYMTGTSTGTSRYHKSIVGIRGDIFAGPNSRVALLVDGVPMREIFQAGGDADVYELFPMDAISRIEIIRGPGAYLYGANSISGAINIVTKLGWNPHVQVGVDGGSKQFLRQRAHGGFHIGDATLAVTAQNQTQDGWRYDYIRPGNGDTVDQYLRAEGHSILLSGELNRTSLVLYHSNYTNTASLDHNDGEFDLNLNKFFGEARYYFYREGHDVSMLSLSGAFKENLSDDTYAPGGAAIVQAHESYASLNYKQQLAIGENRLLFGANLMQTHAETDPSNSVVFVKEANHTTISLFGQYFHTISESVSSDIGVYVTKKSELDVNVSPRAGLLVDLGSHHKLKLVYNAAYREPSMVETNIDVPSSLVGNPNLRVETAHNIDVQYLYTSDNIHASVALYFNSVHDIVLRLYRNNLSDTIVNIGRMNLFGGEVDYRWHVYDNLLLFGSVNYSLNEKEDGLYDWLGAPQTPELIVKQGAVYTREALDVGIFAAWYGDGQQSSWQQQEPFTNPFPDSYVELDTRISYKFRNVIDGIAVNPYFKVSNILDESIYNTYRVPNSIPAKPGRRFQLGVNVEFK